MNNENANKPLSERHNLKILIVDDSLLAEHALKSYFERLGHKVVALAKTGEIGREKFLETSPDLVTVDEVMPGMSGTEFIKFLNEQEKKTGKQTKILMISSDQLTDEVKESIRVDKYLLKPITLEKVRETLTSL